MTAHGAIDSGLRPPRGRRLLYVVGAVVTATSAATLPGIVTGLVYREWDDVAALAVGGAVIATIGLAAWRVVGRPGPFNTREGLAVVSLAWIAMTVAGTLPYLLSGAISGPTDAVFESAAGFTTTGATVFPDPAVLSHALLMWRATTQWIGGMGVIVLFVAVLPLLGVGSVELARAEAPGPEPERLTPRFQQTAKRLWVIYLGLTGAEVVLLAAGDMSLFEAVANSMTTVSTGGFSTTADSLGAFGAYSQWVVVAFMFLAGTSFALHFRARAHVSRYLGNAEFRLYGSIVIAAAALIGIGIATDGTAAASVRDAVFSAVSLVTGTGYHTANFGAWTGALQVLVVALMFTGAMAGSTTGAIKTYRLGVLTKSSAAGLKRVAYPDAVITPRFGGRPLPEAIVRNTQTLFLFYMMVFVTATVGLALVDAASGSAVDLVTATSAVASALGNIGPGLAGVGPGESYQAIAAGGKWLLAFVMIVGRLEIFPMLLLFTRYLWRR